MPPIGSLAADKAGNAKGTDTSPMPTRRVFLRMATAQGIALPAACGVLYDIADAGPAGAAKPAHPQALIPAHKGAVRPQPGLEPAHAQIMRDFVHPKLELTR